MGHTTERQLVLGVLDRRIRDVQRRIDGERDAKRVVALQLTLRELIAMHREVMTALPRAAAPAPVRRRRFLATGSTLDFGDD